MPKPAMEIWRHRTGPYYKETQGGDGPRSTPTVDGETVYVLGATGKLFRTRSREWHADLGKGLGRRVQQPSAEVGV